MGMEAVSYTHLDVYKRQGIYRWDNNECIEVVDQFPSNIDELVEILNGYEDPMIFNGDGSVIYRDRLENSLNKKAYFAPEVFNYLKASTPVSYTHLDVYKRQL